MIRGLGWSDINNSIGTGSSLELLDCSNSNKVVFTRQEKYISCHVTTALYNYSRCPKGETGCILSWNRLEIFRREDNAAKRLKCRIGDTITVTENRTKRCRE